MTTPRPMPRRVLVVGWFPAADDTGAGRFIADQVAALRMTGAVEPSVVSFENAAVRGPAGLRDRQAAAVIANGEAALIARSPFSVRGAAGPPDVPLARLSVAAGATPASGPDHRAIHREAALRPLADSAGASAWELVHAHVGYPEGAAAATVARRLDLPLVVTEHASYLASLLAEPLVRERYRDAARTAARFVAVSRVLGRELVAAFPELEDRLVVIPNAVAVEEFGGTPDERVPGELLWVGHRSATKGMATLLRAFAIIHERKPETRLRLIGRSVRPEDEASWRRLAGELGIGVAVSFEPPAERSGVAAAMRRADLFVHPSPRETFGVVAVEALASGLPVVSTDSGGVSEILGEDPDRLGSLVPVENPAALAAAVVGALDRRATFDPAALRAHAVERFGAARVAGRIVELYEDVLAEHAGASRPQRRLSADPPGAAGPGAETGPARRTIVVGFSRSELDRALARFPAWVFAGAGIVTCGAPIDGRSGVVLAPAGTELRLAELLEWGAPPVGHIGRLGRRLRRTARRLATSAGRRHDGAASILGDLARTLGAALPAMPSQDAPLLVCLAGIDHLVAASFVAEGRAVSAPGGLRWLADVRAAAGRPAGEK